MTLTPPTFLISGRYCRSLSSIIKRKLCNLQNPRGRFPNYFSLHTVIINSINAGIALNIHTWRRHHSPHLHQLRPLPVAGSHLGVPDCWSHSEVQRCYSPCPCLHKRYCDHSLSKTFQMIQLHSRWHPQISKPHQIKIQIHALCISSLKWFKMALCNINCICMMIDI